MPRYGRTNSEFLKARAQVLARAAICYRCGRPLDFNAPARSRWSPSVDHLIPLSYLKTLDESTFRNMSSDPRNLKACHYGCNSARRDRPVTQRPNPTSRAW